MADKSANKTDGTSSVGDQTILEIVAENQDMIKGLLASLPATIASATAVALRQPPCVSKKQSGGVLINNR